ncbi:S49 family peptidase [Luteibacter pinisoli]|uniref:S49 family peptidase n=1 Tax=Luteibacter pinisoli TaxID=2589080 RepID=A0A4Y5YXS3_9GAMM|nr:S49 family peptidase [Luteibacter pinisoli]QDE37782.1 S49 family peptidase [Luteibacter pinisoli]
MPNWNETLAELDGDGESRFDRLRKKYLTKLADHTGRNVLVYYSAWLQQNDSWVTDLGICDADKAGFMTCSHGVRRDRGLDIILHTPGGDLAATEAIIDYLHSMYDGDIRALVPQLAMSGGTLMALSCKEIIMGRQSSLGPVDPQISGFPAQGVIEEFARAGREVSEDPSTIPLWSAILGKYWPTLLTSCEHASTWSDELLRGYLSKCMFAGDDPIARARKLDQVSDLLGKHSTSRNHARHISPERAAAAGLHITALEDDQTLQDLVLTLHHGLSHTFASTDTAKIIANDSGTTYTLSMPVH